MTELILYEQAKRALCAAKSTDEVKNIRDKAIAIKAYAAQAKDKQMEADAYEIRRRAERRLGELIEEQRETVGMATGGDAMKARVAEKPELLNLPPTLADAGIDKNLAHAARTAAKIPEPVFEKEIAQKRQIIINGPHVSNNSGENEWYTPAEYIRAAIETMGGIDCDPASSEIANRTVQAVKYFAEKDDGLTKKWNGRVWINPPYSQPLIARFCAAIHEKFLIGEIAEACVLVNNATETQWFQTVLKVAAAICFPTGRIKFIDKSGNPSGAPLQGQAVLYLGPHPDVFVSSFGRFGFVSRLG